MAKNEIPNGNVNQLSKPNAFIAYRYSAFNESNFLKSHLSQIKYDDPFDKEIPNLETILPNE